MSFTKGTRLGHYEITAPLGVGGMGEIYLAEDARLGRRVALKILPKQYLSDTERLRRFELEAKAASALNHPNIVTIYEVGLAETEAGPVRFIATEYVEGETLRYRLSNTLLTTREVLNLAQQITSALVAAHAAGIVHRDIKPENIMIRRDGYVKVLDFGLAKLLERKPSVPDPEAPTLALKTDPGKVMGTVSYMSPEQARGQEVDGRSDLFSLGVVLYEMLAGRLPFSGPSSADVISGILHKDPPPLEHVSLSPPPELSWIVMKALEKDREERYQNAKSLLSDLKRCKKRLEFAAEMGRTSPSLSNADRTVTSQPEITAPMTITHDPFRTETLQRTTSSAEYLISEFKQHRHRYLSVLVVLLSVLAGALHVALRESPLETLAVLPFVTHEAETEVLGDNLTAHLINQLSQLPKLKVKPLNLVSQYKGRQSDTQAIGQALDVQALLVGRIAKRGNDFAINIELINARDNTLIWGQQYQRKFSDLLLVEQEITRDVAQRLRIQLDGATRDHKLLEAQQLYQRGRYLWNLRTTEALQKALAEFQQALVIAPNFALAYTGVADCYNMLGGYNVLPPREAFPKAKAAALRALELDGSLAEAHTALAYAAVQYDWDWLTAELEYKRALELNPNYAPAHQWYSSLLVIQARTAEAVLTARRAQELDPLSLIINSQLGRVLYYADNFAEAATQLEKTLALDPSFFGARRYLGLVYIELGRHDEAIAHLNQSLSLSGGNLVVKTELAHAYAVAGNLAEARKILKEVQASNKAGALSAYHIAAVHAGLGDQDAAFEQLEKALEERADRMAYLKVDPRLKPLRNDPRFAQLAQRLGL
jgi:eukaryotic-like serine/threonine-protein kinase